MFTITKTITFCYGHRIINHDGKCRHLHGHSATAEFELTAENLNDLGMVRDFSFVKKVMEEWIAENLGHKMILSKEDPFISILQEKNEPIFILDNNPTAENLSLLLYNVAKEQSLPVSKVTVWESPSSLATYSENN